MSSTIVDRRNNSNKDKTLGSRKRFLDRADGAVKKAVTDAMSNGSIKNFSNTKVRVPIRGMGEPTFHHDPKTGKQDRVISGNPKGHVKGDKIERNDGGSGGSNGRGKGGQGTDGEDDFEFELTDAEVMQYFFDELQLPDFIKKDMAVITESQWKRAGYSVDGPSQNLSLSKSMIQAIGRRIAHGRPSARQIEELENDVLLADDDLKQSALDELDAALKRRSQVPYFDPNDLRYRMLKKEEKPVTQALMVCIMDVSGSMTEREKNIAKRFFIFLHLFLKAKYDGCELVLIRHHSTAEECNEHDFFYKTESGGTEVSTALELANKIIKERYPSSTFNIYVAHASDGDNFESDNERCKPELATLLGASQYYAYLDIPSFYRLSSGDESSLMGLFNGLKTAYPHLATAIAKDEKEVWTVFEGLFRKDKGN